MNENNNYQNAYETFKNLPTIMAWILGILFFISAIAVSASVHESVAAAWFFGIIFGGAISVCITYFIMKLCMAPVIVLIETTIEIRNAIVPTTTKPSGQNAPTTNSTSKKTPTTNPTSKKMPTPTSAHPFAKQVMAEKLTTFQIPNDQTIIEDFSFYACTPLKEIVIPNGVTSIGKSAFVSCTGLKKIVIPNSVQFIHPYAFTNCGSLFDVYYTGTVEEWGKIVIGNGNHQLKTATIHYNYTPN